MSLMKTTGPIPPFTATQIFPGVTGLSLVGELRILCGTTGALGFNNTVSMNSDGWPSSGGFPAPNGMTLISSSSVVGLGLGAQPALYFYHENDTDPVYCSVWAP